MLFQMIFPYFHFASEVLITHGGSYLLTTYEMPTLFVENVTSLWFFYGFLINRSSVWLYLDTGCRRLPGFHITFSRQENVRLSAYCVLVGLWQIGSGETKVNLICKNRLFYVMQILCVVYFVKCWHFTKYLLLSLEKIVLWLNYFLDPN